MRPAASYHEDYPILLQAVPQGQMRYTVRRNDRFVILPELRELRFSVHSMREMRGLATLPESELSFELLVR